MTDSPREPLRRPRTRSIAALVVVVVVGLTLTLLGAAGCVWFFAIHRNMEIELQALNEAMADQGSSALSLPMWNVDQQQIRRAGESLLKVPSVQSVVVRALPTGRDALRLEKDSSGIARSVDSVESGDERFRVVHPVTYNGETIGEVEVRVTTRLIGMRLRRTAVALGLFLLVVGSILSGALYYVLWKLVLHPLVVLEQFSTRIDTEQGVRPVMEGGAFHGELASLRSSLQGMVALLDDRYLELQERTKRHQASEELFRTVIDTIPDLVWLKDADGVYLTCNRQFERLYGAPEKGIVGRRDIDFVGPELAEFFRMNDLRAIETGRPTRNEEWVVYAEDGSRVLLDTVKTPMRDPDGKLVGVLGVGRDITARHLADEERRLLDERMNNLQKLEALGVLVAGVAHNINNVLAAVMGTASMRMGAVGQQEDRDSWEMVVTACRRGRDVVRSLMQFARPTLSSQAPVDLNGLLVEVRTLLSNTGRGRVEVREALREGPLVVLGDAGGISNSFLNLCLNSIDAMPDGGTITLSTSVPEPGWAEVSVADTGEGMDPEMLQRVLEPFFTTKEVGKGTGLGLSMTHGVVKAHGGTMRIESTPGVGTVVFIRLPLLADDAPESQMDSEIDEPAAGSMRILLVDDDDDIRLLVSRMLKATGHRVETAASGMKALERLEALDLPDLVVMDQNMPGMDGVATMKAMRERFPLLPILISSGQPDIHEWECFQAPGVAVLSKPFDMRELMAKIARFGLRA